MTLEIHDDTSCNLFKSLLVFKNPADTHPQIPTSHMIVRFFFVDGIDPFFRNNQKWLMHVVVINDNGNPSQLRKADCIGYLPKAPMKNVQDGGEGLDIPILGVNPAQAVLAIWFAFSPLSRQGCFEDRRCKYEMPLGYTEGKRITCGAEVRIGRVWLKLSGVWVRSVKMTSPDGSTMTSRIVGADAAEAMFPLG